MKTRSICSKIRAAVTLSRAVDNFTLEQIKRRILLK